MQSHQTWSAVINRVYQQTRITDDSGQHTNQHHGSPTSESILMGPCSLM